MNAEGEPVWFWRPEIERFWLSLGTHDKRELLALLRERRRMVHASVEFHPPELPAQNGIIGDWFEEHGAPRHYEHGIAARTLDDQS